jgi:DNA-binding MarR family transcriptional regulator
MHKVFFGLKRAYHGTLRITRRALTQLGLTAARFDLLYILVTEEGEELVQADIRRGLGVAASTVSRMLASLEALSLVRRRRSVEDRRNVIVSLTKAGRRCIRMAARVFVRRGYAELAVDSALSPDDWHDEMAAFMARARCENTLRSLSEAYGDVATLNYPMLSDEN